MRLELVGISKQYPAVKANDGVSLRVEPGEIHAVLGENGAGKSTLMKIIYGAVRPDEGEIRWNGAAGRRCATRSEARALGISMVFQHFCLFDTLTAAENVWLGLDKSLPLADGDARASARSPASYGLEVDPLRPVHTLSVGERQRVEIVRALLTQPQLLILDEPTSVLTPQAVRDAVRHAAPARRRGLLDPLHQPQARRDPRAVPPLHGAARRQGHGRGRSDEGEQRQPVAADDRRRAAAAAAPRGAAPARSALDGARPRRCRRTTRSAPRSTASRFEVRAGEIVGIAGVSGNGQQELMAALSGEDRARAARARSGCSAATSRAHSPRRAPRAAACTSCPRSASAAARCRRCRWRRTRCSRAPSAVGRARLAAHRRRRARWPSALIRRFNVKAGGPGAAAKSLSGGNLQKFIVGREIDAEPEAADRLAADLGRRRRRRRADPRRAARAARRRLRACWSSARSSTSCSRSATALVVIAQGRVSPSVADRARPRSSRSASG